MISQNSDPSPHNGTAHKKRIWTKEQLAEFVHRHKPQIRELAGKRLSDLARREGDSEDVAASVLLRMLELAKDGKIAPQSDDELLSLIAVVTSHNALDKHRLMLRAMQMMPEDAEYVTGLIENLETCRDDDDATLLVHRMVGALTDETDRQVLLLRLRGAGHRAVANLLRISVSGAQKRWIILRDNLAAGLRRGDFNE